MVFNTKVKIMKLFQPGFWDFYHSHLLPLEKGEGTVAVIFSSPTILGRGLGKDIDGHDCVMRFNLAPAQGYEADVGSRTTHRLVAEKDLEPIYFREADEFCIRIDRPHFSQLSLLEQDYTNSKHPSNRPFFDKYGILSNHVQQRASTLVYHVTKENVSGFSTGFIGLIYAMATYTEVTLYGFESEWNKDTPIHYFNNRMAIRYAEEKNRGMNLKNPGKALIAGFAEKGRDAGNHPHCFGLERKTIAAMAESGLLRIP
jgi:hypothetical protein